MTSRPRVVQQFHAAGGGAALEQAGDLLLHARRGRLLDREAALDHRLPRGAVHLEAQPGAELDGAHHADGILLEPEVRIADGPDDPAVQVVHAPDVVEDRVVAHVVEEAVDGEVPPEGVLFGAPEGVVAADVQVGRLLVALLLFERQAVLEVGLAAERGDLHDLVAAEVHVRQPEAPADEPAVPEELLDLRRPRRGGDVEVLRLAPQHEVADPSADQVGGVPRAVQAVEDLQGVGIDVLARDRMLGPRDDLWLHHPSMSKCESARPQPRRGEGTGTARRKARTHGFERSCAGCPLQSLSWSQGRTWLVGDRHKVGSGRGFDLKRGKPLPAPTEERGPSPRKRTESPNRIQKGGPG